MAIANLHLPDTSPKRQREASSVRRGGRDRRWHFGLLGWLVAMLTTTTLFARPTNVETGPTALPLNEPVYELREPQQYFFEGEVPPQHGPFTPSWKPQAVQEVYFDWNTIYGRQGATMGELELATQATFAVPWIVLGSPWLITPHFGVHLMQGPDVTDMPGHLFDVSIGFGRVFQLAPKWQLETGYGLGYYSDFDQGRSEALRVIGRAVAYRDLSTTWQAALGATYLGRYDYPVLPVAGLIWSPDDRTRLDLVFPSPRFQRRLVLPASAEKLIATPLAQKLGFYKEDEYSWYLRGDFGGNTYAIRRVDGRSDMVTIRDLRFAIGYERRGVLGFVSRSEVGIAFARDLKYSSDPTHFTLTEALMFRSEYAF
jgi:hypothetical protein